MLCGVPCCIVCWCYTGLLRISRLMRGGVEGYGIGIWLVDGRMDRWGRVVSM